jgi:hypothetical protein
MNVDREWVTREPEQSAVDSLVETLDCSPTLARILANREQTDPESAKRYLQAPLDALEDPQFAGASVVRVTRKQSDSKEPQSALAVQ